MRTVKPLFIALLFALAACGPVTPEPADTSTPSPTLQASVTPTASQTPRPLNPTATQPRIVSHLPYNLYDEGIEIVIDCERDATYTHCFDPILQIAFEYPTSWGKIIPFLGSGSTGYQYIYDIQEISGQWTIAGAGGLSGDYSAGREGSLYDFGGWDSSSWSASDVCEQWARAEVCEEIRPGVIFALSPNLEEFCTTLAYSLWPPYASVIVQLPDNPAINGFIFVTYPFSESDRIELESLIGLDREGLARNCDAETYQTYNALLQEIALGQPTDFVDAYSAQNIRDLLHLAESIEFR